MTTSNPVLSLMIYVLWGAVVIAAGLLIAQFVQINRAERAERKLRKCA